MINKHVLGIGIVKLLFEKDRNELFVKVSALNWKKISYILGCYDVNNFIHYFGIVYKNDKMFSLDLALSKSVYSASSITLQARLWRLVILDTFIVRRISLNGITII